MKLGAKHPGRIEDSSCSLRKITSISNFVSMTKRVRHGGEAFVGTVSFGRCIPLGPSVCFGALSIQDRRSWFGTRLRIFHLYNTRVANRSKNDTGFPCIRRQCRAILGGGGILGVGPWEVAVIFAVGWFLLGPEKLFELSKDVGRVIGQLRRSANEARESLSEAFEADIHAIKEREGRLGRVQGPLTLEETMSGLDTEQRYNGMADADHGELEVETLKEEESKIRLGNVSDAQQVDGAEATRRNFLDQLRRVSDENQTAPHEMSELTDLDMNEELEVARLEREYLTAKERLARKRSANAAESTPSNSKPIPVDNPAETDS